MSSESYFYEQFSRASHLGGIHRAKRNSKELNQALYQSRVALASGDDDDSNKSTPTSGQKQAGYTNLQTILLKLNLPIIPEIMTKELDTILHVFENKSKTISLSNSFKSPDDNMEDEMINGRPNLPRISLPSSLVLRMHSTWSDLIKNAEYKYRMWRTKAGENAWNQYVERKRSEHVKLERRQNLNDIKTSHHRRKSSRVSISSGTNNLHRQSLTTNTHANRSPSRASMNSTGEMTQDNLRLLKVVHQGALENAGESNRNGIHVEFKLSTQIFKTVQKPQRHDQKFVLFDVQKPGLSIIEEMILSTQNNCKRLLAETKQKILATTNESDLNICRVWCYEDNQFNRTKNNLLLDEFDRRQKSKFLLSILRQEIPEKYNINLDIPEGKHKCYIELIDGSSQIYYPSGRLAVLRLRSPISTTLFFDDTVITAKQLLGLVTSTGDVILMQPTFHARFITNNQHGYAYLCNAKTGLIEKQLQWYSTNHSRRQSIRIDEDNIDFPLLENTVQFQLNSFMQLEYNNRTDIRFAFTCQNEEFKFQLGLQTPMAQSSTLMDITTTILATKKLSGEKKIPRKRTSSINSNETSNVVDRQQIQSQRLTDEHGDFQQLPIMKELILLRKRIRLICDSWLNEYRTTLGIMDIDAYCLSDLPSSLPQLPPIDDTNQNDNMKESVHVPLLIKRASLSIDFNKPIEKQQLLRRSTKLSELNVIANSIEQFVPHSAAGRAIKQRICKEKKLSATILPIIE